MPIFGVKSSFLEFGILAVQKRELIIEEVHIDMPPVLYYNNDVHENERINVHEQTGI